jgi:hypothetical protein
MSPRWNWDSPNPFPASECVLPPPWTGVGESQFRRLDKMFSTLPTLWCTLLTTVSTTVWMLISAYRPSFDVKTFPMECGCIFVLILSEASLSLIWIFLFTAVLRIRIWIRIRRIRTYVFGPSGSRSGYISERYGSGSFYHQAKVVRKTLIPTVFWVLFDFLSL